MATLQEPLLTPENAPHLIADTQALVDGELASRRRPRRAAAGAAAPSMMAPSMSAKRPVLEAWPPGSGRTGGCLRGLRSVERHHRFTADHPTGVADHQRARRHRVGDAVLLRDEAAVSGRCGRRDQFRAVADPHTVVAVQTGLVDHPRVRCTAECDRRVGRRAARGGIDETQGVGRWVGGGRRRGDCGQRPARRGGDDAESGATQVRGHQAYTRTWGTRRSARPRRAAIESLAP